MSHLRVDYPPQLLGNSPTAPGTSVAAVDGAMAPVTGTYLILVGSFDSAFDGTGTYSLTATIIQ